MLCASLSPLLSSSLTESKHPRLLFVSPNLQCVMRALAARVQECASTQLHTSPKHGSLHMQYSIVYNAVNVCYVHALVYFNFILNEITESQTPTAVFRVLTPWGL